MKRGKNLQPKGQAGALKGRRQARHRIGKADIPNRPRLDKILDGQGKSIPKGGMGRAVEVEAKGATAKAGA
ncbi:hypothetical protein JCM17846_10840 [Iodidimonas nitroreducens]|uniref:Uncharacterized protein n=1 Tax=Iodidimonas nitroreducens TaxID=1236968 RepID=A0A5A7N529_9PROT|nr:hypothetical protein JCM17846_10840 [Iodidimonas nitroreducens]